MKKKHVSKILLFTILFLLLSLTGCDEILTIDAGDEQDTADGESADTDGDSGFSITEAVAFPDLVCAGRQVLLSASLKINSAPVKTVFVDLASLAKTGETVKKEMTDDGQNGDALAGDGVYSILYTIPDAVLPGRYELKVSVSGDDGSSSASAVINLTVQPTSSGGTGVKGRGNVSIYGPDVNPSGYDEIPFGETLYLDVENFITTGREHRVEIHYKGATIERYNTSETLISFRPDRSGSFSFRVYYLNEAFLCDAYVRITQSNNTPTAVLSVRPETPADLTAYGDEQKESSSIPMEIGNEKLYLDASASSDNDGDALTFEWNVMNPDKVQCNVSAESPGGVSFIPSAAGLYCIKLTAKDGIEDPARDNTKAEITQYIYIYDQNNCSSFYRNVISIEKNSTGGDYSVYLYLHDYWYYYWMTGSGYIYVDFVLKDNNNQRLAYGFYEYPMKAAGDFVTAEEYDNYCSHYIGSGDSPSDKGRDKANWLWAGTLTAEQAASVSYAEFFIEIVDSSGNFRNAYFYSNSGMSGNPQTNILIKTVE